MSASGVSAVGERTCSSTIGPALVERIWANVWSLATLRWNTTVVSSGASVLARLASSEGGRERGGGQRGGGAVLVVDLEDPVEAELHVRGREVVAVDELQAGLQLHR